MSQRRRAVRMRPLIKIQALRTISIKCDGMPTPARSQSPTLSSPAITFDIQVVIEILPGGSVVSRSYAVLHDPNTSCQSIFFFF